MNEVDDNFFKRADEHIHLSNEQLSKVSMGKVSASMMYSAARFNSWVSACNSGSAQEMEKSKQGIIKYFLPEYEKMLIENLKDYIENFDDYMNPSIPWLVPRGNYILDGATFFVNTDFGSHG